MSAFSDFVLNTRFEDLPDDVVAILRRSLLDSIGVAAAGSTMKASKIAARHAVNHWAAGPTGPQSRLLLAKGAASPAGVAFAGAAMIDSVDAHDGHSPVKGHAGSGILPALFAFADAEREQGATLDGRELLTAMAIGYEIGYRSGLAMHATVADYHTSGAWTAVGAAAVGARLMGFPSDQLRHAVGIAEYHGPRSQMMRVIDHPSMLRDGVIWGSPSGVTAAYLARDGFTGAPAITVEGEAEAPFWQGLGSEWEIRNTHYKRYPVCRWAHPAIDAAQELMAEHGLSHEQVKAVEIRTFHNAIRLAGQNPKTLDDVAYGIAYGVAAMIVRGRIGIEEISEPVLEDPDIRRISLATDLIETEHYNAISVGVRWADVTLVLSDGTRLQSPPRKPRGDPDDPLSDQEITEKYHRFADPVLGEGRSSCIAGLISDLPDRSDVSELLGVVLDGQP